MRRIALAVLGAAPLVLLAASFVDGPGAWLAAAVAVAGLPPAAMVLGMGERPRRGAVVVVTTLWGVLTAGLGCVVLLASGGSAGPGPLGLPWPAVVAIGGLALAPLVLVSLGYALTFRPPPAARPD